MFEDLDSQQRLQLLQFVCAFAWADLEVRDEERSFVKRMVEHMDLSERDQGLVEGWLRSPPPVESVDPMQVPEAHRKLYLHAIEGVIASDGEISDEERESLELVRELFA